MEYNPNDPIKGYRCAFCGVTKDAAAPPLMTQSECWRYLQEHDCPARDQHAREYQAAPRAWDGGGMKCSWYTPKHPPGDDDVVLMREGMIVDVLPCPQFPDGAQGIPGYVNGFVPDWENGTLIIEVMAQIGGVVRLQRPLAVRSPS